VIEEETGSPLEIQAPGAGAMRAPAAAAEGPGPSGEARLIARDERKNPLISTFDWTDDAAQRILRVPAGFMRNKTQERIEELARERAATTIDLTLVEDGIEFGKRMMAEMMATYSPPASAGAAGAGAAGASAPSATASGTPAEDAPRAPGGGYLNEVRSH
jgi:hypothetical protein